MPNGKSDIVYFARMNFLGHFYLSGNSPGLIIGNYIADFVKGKNYLQYPDAVMEGILMHREIDSFTDHHPKVLLSKKRLFEKHRHYSLVIVDLFYDHFLARNWQRYSHTALETYAQAIYSMIESHWEILPEPSRFMFPYMKKNNWLLRYAEIDGIALSLRGLAQRTRHPSRLAEAADDLLTWDAEFEKEFFSFFADISDRFQVKPD